jgi:hypothetical protein
MRNICISADFFVNLHLENTNNEKDRKELEV